MQVEHWAVDKMAARLAAMLEKAKGRNLIERMDVLTPRPFDRCTTATIPQVRLQRLLIATQTVMPPATTDQWRATSAAETFCMGRCLSAYCLHQCTITSTPANLGGWVLRRLTKHLPKGDKSKVAFVGACCFCLRHRLTLSAKRLTMQPKLHL